MTEEAKAEREALDAMRTAAQQTLLDIDGPINGGENGEG